VDAANRKKLAQSDSRLVQSLISLMDARSLKVQCQAALALRNLASDEKYQLEIVRLKGLPPLLRLLKTRSLALILSSVACIRNISIHTANESPIIDAGFVDPLIALLSYDDNEEVQCHAISTLRNLAASSERNKRAIVDAGAVERIKELVNIVPVSVQSEMTAAIAVLALSDELKQRLLSMGILQVLVSLTGSSNLEVQGNSAAAIGNLSSKVKDYSPFIRVWDSPSGGLHSYLVTFLEDGQDTAFQHIGVWTLVQFLEGGDKELIKRLSKAPDLVTSIARIANLGTDEDHQGMNGRDDDTLDDADADVHELAKRVINVIGPNLSKASKKSAGKKQR